MKTIKSKVEIDFSIEIYEEDGDEKGFFSCYIPEYKVAFSTKKSEDIEKKSKVMVKGYLNMLAEINQKEVSK